ncbi:hypothetical protein [Lichenihabitans psoromatis]|uniref:hypothetical protein n=1 Tax=Lichenihabitans psoromatis TaxID=2528642 RepID=UPI001036A67D|nr:hypothetical protein [Lichenihabitans psoromatis]
MTEFQAEKLVRPGGTRFVGFYWTLPIPAVGFVRLPKAIDDAAAASRTIRYQRERVRRWVESQKGHIVAEFAFLELRPDRGSDAVAEELGKALRKAQETGATFVYIRFADYHQARLHPFMQVILQVTSVPCVGLPPDPEQVGFETFDPIAHFRKSRKTLPRAWDSERQEALQAAVNAAVVAVGDVRGKAERIAEHLNSSQIRTTNGRAWTGSNVRAFMRKLG